MAGKADGSIIIDTGINADGLKAGEKEIVKALKQIANTLNDISGLMKGFSQNAAKSLIDVGRQAENASNSIASIQDEMDDFDSHDFEIFRGDVEDAADSLENLSDAMKETKTISASSMGYDQDAIRFIDEFAENMGKASEQSNEFLAEIENAQSTLKGLEESGKWFGDEEFDEAYVNLKRLEAEMKEYKKELENPSPSKDVFGLDTLEGKLQNAEKTLRQLTNSGKGIENEKVQEQLHLIAELKEQYKNLYADASKTDSTRQKEADALAAKEAKIAEAIYKDDAIDV